VTIYDGLTLGFIAVGILFIVLSFLYDRTKKTIDQDEAALEDETFRKQISIINEKIVEMNEYHDYVQKEMEKKHKELLFLYQMISEKEKLVRQIQVAHHEDTPMHEVPKAFIGVNAKVNTEEEKTEEKKISTTTNTNMKILEMKSQGYQASEIAKILNIGQGEVQLVINLFE
jgi:transcriptional regulator